MESDNRALIKFEYVPPRNSFITDEELLNDLKRDWSIPVKKINGL